MIIDGTGTLALSNLRWVDGGNLWSYALGHPEPIEKRLSDANWLTLVQGTKDYFAVVHHFEDGRVQLTSHSYPNISQIVSSVELQIENVKSEIVEPAISRFAGEVSSWSFLPKAYVIRPFEEPLLLLIDGRQGTSQIQSPSWYRESHDTMYQGILNVTEVPGNSLLIFSIQRDSEPVVYDPLAKKVINKLKLGEQSAAPQLLFRRTAPELWASDYDTLVKLDSREWNILNRLKLQEGRSGMVRSNIGKFCFDGDETLCLVARPHSGDVLGIDPNTFKITFRAETGGQPEEVGLLRGGLVIARDLKTGGLLQGTLNPI